MAKKKKKKQQQQQQQVETFEESLHRLLTDPDILRSVAALAYPTIDPTGITSTLQATWPKRTEVEPFAS